MADRVRYLPPIKLTSGQAELIQTWAYSHMLRCDDQLALLAQEGVTHTDPAAIALRMDKRKAENIVKKMNDGLAEAR